MIMAGVLPYTYENSPTAVILLLIPRLRDFLQYLHILQELKESFGVLAVPKVAFLILKQYGFSHENGKFEKIDKRSVKNLPDSLNLPVI